MTRPLMETGEELESLSDMKSDPPNAPGGPTPSHLKRYHGNAEAGERRKTADIAEICLAIRAPPGSHVPGP